MTSEFLRPELVSQYLTVGLFAMAFSKNIRDWWMRVTDGKDMTMEYDEKRGWHLSGKPAQEVDHITPGADLSSQGLDPNLETGVPRSREHHTGRGLLPDGTLAPHGDPRWSRHPDMGRAREEYRKGKKDSFKEAVKKHREWAAVKGGEWTNDDPRLRGYYEQLMQEKAFRYVLETGDKRPSPPKHKKKRIRVWDENLMRYRDEIIEE